MNVDVKTMCTLGQYLDFLSKKASGINNAHNKLLLIIDFGDNIVMSLYKCKISNILKYFNLHLSF